MDLGTILGNISSIAQTYQTITAPRPVMNTLQPQPAGFPGFPNADLPFVDVVPQPPMCNTNEYYWSTRANRGQGGWVKYRRRRKQLATKSDISQLASLKTVLTGDNLKMWIATHG